MITATATTECQMTADEAFAEVERHRVALTPALDLWAASCVLKSPRKVGRSVERLVSAVASTPIGAVEALLLKLAAEATEQELFDETIIED